MSGNINDTNTELIKQQVENLQKDISDIYSRNETVNDWKDSLSKKYKHLSKTSNTLFKYIIENYGTDKFNQSFFDKTITMMLSKISNIQNSNVTQENASVYIGTHLAQKFIPQCSQK